VLLGEADRVEGGQMLTIDPLTPGVCLGREGKSTGYITHAQSRRQFSAE
jgi:hypothetical protein